MPGDNPPSPPTDTATPDPDPRRRGSHPSGQPPLTRLQRLLSGPRRLARRLIPRNALAVTFWLLVGAAVIGAAGVLLAALFPEAAGVAPDEFVRDEAYRVERVNLKRGYLELVFPDAHLVPVYRGGEVVGAVLVGAGRYVLQPQGTDRALMATLTGFEAVQDNITAAYVSMGYRELENTRYTGGGRREDDVQALERARRLLERRRQIHPSVAGAGLAALFREPNQDAIFAEGVDLGALLYRPAQPHEVHFVDLGTVAVRFGDLSGPSPTGSAGAFQLDVAAPVAVALFASVLLLLLIMVVVLTADLEPLRPAAGLHLARERATWLGALLLAVMEIVVVYMDQVRILSIETGWLYTAFALLALLRPLQAGPRLVVTGLSLRRAGRGLVVGLLVGVLGFLGASLRLPYGIDAGSAAHWPLLVAQGFVLQGLATEVYRRGLLQVTLQALGGRRVALLLSPPLVGLLYILPRVMAQPAAWPQLLVEGLVLVALGETIFAFLFDRTGSVWAGTVARGVLFVAQRLLLY